MLVNGEKKNEKRVRVFERVGKKKKGKNPTHQKPSRGSNNSKEIEIR